MNINIKATTATELSQIETSETNQLTKRPTVIIKKQKVYTKNSFGIDKVLSTPIFTGNSFRGKLRRKATEHLLDVIIKKGLQLPTAANFNLMNAGGGNLHNKQDVEIEKEVRILNPLISVFGTSLAIAGKIITPTLMPYKNVSDDGVEYYFKENENGNIYSNIITTESFIKKDDLYDFKGLARYMDEETVISWRDRVDGNQKNRASARSNEDSAEKVKKESLAALNDREYIIRGTNLYTSISESNQLNSIERGLIYKCIEDISLESLGSNVSKGFGKMNYEINFDENSILKTRTNEFLKCEVIQKDYSKSVLEDIKAYEEWLENITEKNYQIDEIMTK